MQKVWMCNYVHTFDPARSISGVLSSSKHKSLKISCCYFPEGSAAVSMAAEAPFSTASQAAAFQVRQLQVLPQARAYIQELRKNKISTRSRGGRLVGKIWLSFDWILLTFILHQNVCKSSLDFSGDPLHVLWLQNVFSIFSTLTAFAKLNAKCGVFFLGHTRQITADSNVFKHLLLSFLLPSCYILSHEHLTL